MTANAETINVAKQFSKYPGGRFLSDGDYSGERFREKFLVPALRSGQEVIVELDGTLGYGSSFLEEAFGGLVRVENFTPEQLNKALTISTTNDTLKYTIGRYIQEARQSKAVHH